MTLIKIEVLIKDIVYTKLKMTVHEVAGGQNKVDSLEL